MPVDEDIRTRALAYSGLNTLISGRIHPEKELTGTPTYPYITFTLVSTIEPYLTFSLPTAFERDDQYRFHIWSDSHDSASAVAVQVISGFHGYEAGSTCFVFDDELEIDEDDEHVFHRVVDFVVTSTNEV